MDTEVGDTDVGDTDWSSLFDQAGGSPLLRSVTKTLLALAIFNGSAVAAEIATILESKYEEKMISSGSNRPVLRLWEDQLREILILLHHQTSVSDVQSQFGWSDGELEKRLALLIENDFIERHSSGRYTPTSMVITLEDAKAIQKTARAVAEPAAAVIKGRIPNVRAAYEQLEPFRRIPFEEASLLILSDVLLDNWQINNVEAQLLQKERTPRHGVNYYHSLQEKSYDGVESFGIYGNQMWSHESWMIGIYGNKRTASKHLLSLNDQDRKGLFNVPIGPESKGRLLELLVEHANTPEDEIPADLRSGLHQLGLLENGELRFPILKRSDYDDLRGLADSVTPDLVEVLVGQKGMLSDSYERSIYAEEITFEEYFIWWYHFFYSEVTEILIRDGEITVPAAGVTTYIVDWSQ